MTSTPSLTDHRAAAIQGLFFLRSEISTLLTLIVVPESVVASVFSGRASIGERHLFSGVAHRGGQVGHHEIEAGAKRRLADEYDAAQERGELAKIGDNLPKISKENSKPTLADIGIKPKEIHEARELRDAEEEDPGIVRRTLDGGGVSENPRSLARMTAPQSRASFRQFQRSLFLRGSAHFTGVSDAKR